MSWGAMRLFNHLVSSLSVRARIVFIAELGVLSRAELDGIMASCVANE